MTKQSTSVVRLYSGKQHKSDKRHSTCLEIIIYILQFGAASSSLGKKMDALVLPSGLIHTGATIGPLHDDCIVTRPSLHSNKFSMKQQVFQWSAVLDVKNPKWRYPQFQHHLLADDWLCQKVSDVGDNCVFRPVMHVMHDFRIVTYISNKLTSNLHNACLTGSFPGQHR